MQLLFPFDRDMRVVKTCTLFYVLGSTSESLLWVEKYKPKAIKHIIGQQGDKSNVKKLLRWLQNWHENQKSGKTKGKSFSVCLFVQIFYKSSVCSDHLKMILTGPLRKTV